MLERMAILVLAALLPLPLAAQPVVKGPELIGGRLTDMDYPKAAMNSGEEGAIAIRLTINPNGRVTACQLVREAYNSTLDDSTCDLTTKRFKFRAATDANGAATTGVYWMTIKWVLTGRGPEIEADYKLAVRALPNGQQRATVPVAVITDPQGKVLACNAQSVRGVTAAPSLVGAVCNALKSAASIDPVAGGGFPMTAVQTLTVDLLVGSEIAGR